MIELFLMGCMFTGLFAGTVIAGFIVANLCIVVHLLCSENPRWDHYRSWVTSHFKFLRSL